MAGRIKINKLRREGAQHTKAPAAIETTVTAVTICCVAVAERAPIHPATPQMTPDKKIIN